MQLPRFRSKPVLFGVSTLFTVVGISVAFGLFVQVQPNLDTVEGATLEATHLKMDVSAAQMQPEAISTVASVVQESENTTHSGTEIILLDEHTGLGVLESSNLEIRHIPGPRIIAEPLEADLAKRVINQGESEAPLDIGEKVMPQQQIATGTVEGFVRGPNGDPYVGTKVIVMSYHMASFEGSVFTDQNGYFSLSGVPAGGEVEATAVSQGDQVIGRGNGILNQNGETVSVDVVVQ